MKSIYLPIICIVVLLYGCSSGQQSDQQTDDDVPTEVLS